MSRLGRDARWSVQILDLALVSVVVLYPAFSLLASPNQMCCPGGEAGDSGLCDGCVLVGTVLGKNIYAQLGDNYLPQCQSSTDNSQSCTNVKTVCYTTNNPAVPLYSDPITCKMLTGMANTLSVSQPGCSNLNDSGCE
jgi:hypothetical protein